MFDKIDWLTVRQLIAFHTLITVYRIRMSQEPEDLARMLKRDNHNGHIIMKKTRLETKLTKVKKGVRKWYLKTSQGFMANPC